jgi:uncharacterized protein (DUF305 family)
MAVQKLIGSRAWVDPAKPQAYSNSMAFRFWLIPAGLLCVSLVTSFGQETAPIVQPGAPGHSGKTLSPATAAATAPRAPEEADTKFMQGMIMHHSQAVEMVALMPSRTHNKDLLFFGKRISISQTDEMKFMKQWLEDRGKPVEMEHDMSHMNHMAGMDHSKMAPMMMPGMLTPEQMKALAKATGPAFDHLFLTGMIQHHGGALTMVQELFDIPATGQDSQLYDFVTDVDNTQRAEIGIMQGMLNKEKK